MSEPRICPHGFAVCPDAHCNRQTLDNDIAHALAAANARANPSKELIRINMALVKERDELRDGLLAAESRLREVANDSEQYRKNWLAFQDLTGEQCMDVALPIVQGWKEDSARLLEVAAQVVMAIDSEMRICGITDQLVISSVRGAAQSAIRDLDKIVAPKQMPETVCAVHGKLPSKNGYCPLCSTQKCRNPNGCDWPELCAGDAAGQCTWVEPPVAPGVVMTDKMLDDLSQLGSPLDDVGQGAPASAAPQQKG